MTKEQSAKLKQLQREADALQAKILALLTPTLYAVGTGQREAHEARLVRMKAKQQKLHDQIIAICREPA